MKSLEEIAKESDEILINRVWFNLIRAHRNLYPKIQKQLRKHEIDNPVWYEVLLEIEKAGDAGIRAKQLQEQLYMSQFNLSRHLKRLEKRGFINRIPDTKDSRAHFLVITGDGITFNENMWPLYLEAIQTDIAHRFDRDEALELFRLLTKLYP